MALTYTWGNPLVRPREEAERVTDCARGIVPISEIYDITDRKKPTPHIVIQIKPGAYTEEEWAAMAHTHNGEPTGKTVLSLFDYGIKWRAWYGDPLPEQLAEPWNTIQGGES